MKDAGTEDICQLLQASGEDNRTAKEISLSFCKLHLTIAEWTIMGYN